MTVATIYASSSGYWMSISSTYSSMQTGTGTSFNSVSGASTTFAGQQLISSNYYGYVTKYQFDTSSLPDTATVSSATLSVYVATLTVSQTLSCRYQDQLSWERGTVVASLPTAAALAITTTGVKNLALSNLLNISLTGNTSFTITSTNFEIESAGSLSAVNYSSYNDATNKPSLAVTYTAAYTANAFFTPVSNFALQTPSAKILTGQNHPKIAAKDRSIPNAWTRCTGTMSGQQTSNITFNDYNFPFGTSYVKPVFMLNAGDYGSGTTYASNIVFRRKPY